MAAQKRSSTQSTFFTKDLFIFIAIMAIVAIMTYFLTYNAITAKFSEQVGNTLQDTPKSQSIPQSLISPAE